jgi:hypothetical protein
MKANQNSKRTVEWTKEDKKRYIKRCEKFYKKSTSTMMEELDKNGHEASPEIRRWYRFAKEMG